jgi:hypothetical protein
MSENLKKKACRSIPLEDVKEICEEEFLKRMFRGHKVPPPLKRKPSSLRIVPGAGGRFPGAKRKGWGNEQNTVESLKKRGVFAGVC